MSSFSMSGIYAGFFASTSAITTPVELTCHWTKIHPILELLSHQRWVILLHFPVSVDYIIVTRVLQHNAVIKNGWQCSAIIFTGGTGKIQIEDRQVIVALDKRAHNPCLVDSGLADQPTPMQWLEGKKPLIQFA